MRNTYIVWLTPGEVGYMFGYFASAAARESSPSKKYAIPIPADVVVTASRLDAESNRVGLEISHPSFPEVPDGQKPKELTVQDLMGNDTELKAKE